MVELRDHDVFLDICTQMDYLAQSGARPAQNADAVARNLKHLMALARWARVPVISCVDIQRMDEVRGLPNPTCVLGTPGQRKYTFSLLQNNITVHSDNSLCVSLDILKRHQQAILAKTHQDPFTNPKLDRLLTELPVGRFVLFGVALEHSLRLLALGLLLRHRRVTIVTDACGYWNENEAEMTLRQLSAKGCELLTANEFIERSLARYRTLGNRPRRRTVA